MSEAELVEAWKPKRRRRHAIKTGMEYACMCCKTLTGDWAWCGDCRPMEYRGNLAFHCVPHNRTTQVTLIEGSSQPG